MADFIASGRRVVSSNWIISHYQRYTENCLWLPGLLSYASQYQSLVSCWVLLLKQVKKKKKRLIGLRTDSLIGSLIAQWGLSSKLGEELALNYARFFLGGCVWGNYVKSGQALLLIGMRKRWQRRSAVPVQIYGILKYTDAISVV